MFTKSTDHVSLLLILAIFGFTLSKTKSAQYRLDANNGDDVKGNPYRTWGALRPILEGGDSVIIAKGNYGTIIEATKPETLFPTNVTIQAEEGSEVVFDSLTIGANSRAFRGIDARGTYNANLKFIGITFSDGVSLYGCKQVEFDSCKFERKGLLGGSVEALEKIAFLGSAVSQLTVKNSTVTRTGVGFVLSGFNALISKNKVYDTTHDGIRCVGLASSLFENNELHGMDDGVSDAEADWSRHVDGIHIFISGAPTAESIVPNTDLIFRGNIIYDIESQGVQFNNYFRFPEKRNKNITFENNIFGPTGTITFNGADGVDNLTIRHNSFIPGTRTYSSPHAGSGRTIMCKNNSLRISKACRNVKVYNNILGTALLELETFDILSNNIIQHPTSKTAYPRTTYLISENIFKNPSIFDGVLAEKSPAINAGVMLPDESPYPFDKSGVSRDKLPDIGANEIPLLNPVATAPLSIEPRLPQVLVDDFEDADFLSDPFLNTATRMGLSWVPAEHSTALFKLSRTDSFRNCLVTPTLAGAQSLILAAPEQNWNSYTFQFEAENAYLSGGMGPVFLFQNADNYLFIDIGSIKGALIQKKGGVDSILASHPTLRMPNSGHKVFCIKLGKINSKLSISIDSNSDNKNEVDYIISDETVNNLWRSNRLGFYYTGYSNSHRSHFDNVKISELRTDIDAPRGLRRVGE